MSAQKINESEILELVCDYLSTRGYTEAEKILRVESSNEERPLPSNQFTGCRLQDMLEKSYVTQMVSGENPNKRRRANLDAILHKSPGDDDAITGEMSKEQLAEDPKLTLETRLVSYNPCKNDPHGAAVMPLYQTSTFAQPSATSFGQYDYTRSGNPTRLAFENQVTELEHGYRSFAFSTGMSALSAVTRLAKAGEEIILSDDSYGGTYRLLAKIATRQGISIRYVNMAGKGGPANLAAAISENTALVMLESPTNPMQRIINLRDVSQVAHEKGALVSIDSTMMTPLLQQPLSLGCDIVVHSATKFMCGHSDTMAGTVTVGTKDLADRVYFFQNAEGTGLSPFDSWLMLRGIKTMALRVFRQQETALRVASFLRECPSVISVFYAGLPSHPDHDLHMDQAKGGGSVICFRTGSLTHSQHVVSTVKLFKITVSFGSVNSLISLPGAMSHASIPAEVRKAREFPDDLVRLSVGIETAEDLIADLSRAFATYKGEKAASAGVAVKSS